MNPEMHEKIMKLLPYLITGMITLLLNAIIQATGVSQECQAEIQNFCMNTLQKLMGLF